MYGRDEVVGSGGRFIEVHGKDTVELECWFKDRVVLVHSRSYIVSDIPLLEEPEVRLRSSQYHNALVLDRQLHDRQYWRYQAERGTCQSG